METSGATSQAPDAAPDWATIEREILCPLCNYNLRGLVEPRCPECGHPFLWKEMLARSQWEHPWLFEHARRRKIKPLLRTFFMSQWPTAFWGSVRPNHTPRTKRLIVYWLILINLIVLPAGVFRFWGLATCLANHTIFYQQILQESKASFEYELKHYNNPELVDMIKEAGSVDAFVRNRWTVIPSWRELRWGLGESPFIAHFGWEIAIACFLWPWMTLSSLLIFRWSLRKARIKTVHVLRCAIYSSDAVILLALPAGWLQFKLIAITSQGNWEYAYTVAGRSIFFDWRGFLVIAAVTAIMAFRLGVAYRSYLGFARALAVSAASQIIVILTLLAMSPWGWLI